MTRPSPRGGSDSGTPQSMSGYLDKDWLYGTVVKLDGGALACRWNCVTGALESIDLATVAGNHLELPLGRPDDAHYFLVTGVDDRDHVLIVGNHHDHIAPDHGPLAGVAPTTTHMVECTNVAAFTNPASWVAHSTAFCDGENDPSAVEAWTYTYHHFERLTNGVLLYFCSQSEGGAVYSQGRDYLAYKRTGGSWSPLLSSGGTFARTDTVQNGVDPNRVYVLGVYVEAHPSGDRVWVHGVWRPDNEILDTQKDAWLIRAEASNLDAWTGVDGTAVPMPLYWPTQGAALITAGIWINSHSSLNVNIVSRNPAVLGQEPLLRWAWTGTAWTSSAAAALGGEQKEFRISGRRFQRGQGSSRLFVREAARADLGGAAGPRCHIGGEVVQSGDNFSPVPCPVWLRERNIFAVYVADGDTPKAWTFGVNAKARA